MDSKRSVCQGNYQNCKQLIPIVLAVLGVATVGFLVVVSRGAFASVSDLPEFMAAAKMAASGHGSEIYVIEKLSEMEHFLYPFAHTMTFFVPPFGLPWLMPLTLLPPDIAPLLWKIFLLLCLAMSVPILQRAFSLNRAATCWLSAALCFSGCTFEALRLDQLSMPMFLAFSCAILALKQERPYSAAVALSVLLLKPQELLPFVVFLLGARKSKVLLLLIGIAAFLTVVGFALVGPAGLSNYSQLMKSTITDNRFLVSDISCTIRGQLLRYFPDARVLVHYISLGFLAVSLLVIFAVGRRVAKSRKWLDYGLVTVMPLGMVSALYCYYYDFLLLVPSLILLMTEFEPELPPWSILVGMVLVLAFMMPFSMLIHLNWILAGHRLNPQFAVVLLFAIGCLALFKIRIVRKLDVET